MGDPPTGLSGVAQARVDARMIKLKKYKAVQVPALVVYVLFETEFSQTVCELFFLQRGPCLRAT